MPRIVVVVKSSRGKDVKCGRCGIAIEIGITYRHFQKYKAPKQYRCMKMECNPKQSELTGSDKLSRLYVCQENIEYDVSILQKEENVNEDALNILADAVDAQVEEIIEVGEEYHESADNMSEYFPGSSKVDEIEEKADACEEWAGALEQAASEVRDTEKEEGEEDEAFLARITEIVIEANSSLQM